MRYQISRAVTTTVAVFVCMLAGAKRTGQVVHRLRRLHREKKQEQPFRSRSDIGLLLDFARRGLEHGRFVFLNLCNLRNLWTI
jgi:hypothetical protein